MILGGKVINNAYQAYLALCQSGLENSNQHILFLPQRKMKSEMPAKIPDVKIVKGTQSFHLVRRGADKNSLICSGLSCSYLVCVEGKEGS